jgi:hypothetical protein
MTAHIDYLLVICHEGKVLDVFQHAKEGAIDHDGVTMKVSRVLEDALILTWQVLAGLREIFTT